MPFSVISIYQVNGCLSYYDKVPDGFYLIQGVDPYVWTLCSDLHENGRLPSIGSLKEVEPNNESSIEAVTIDRRSDLALRELESRVVTLSSSCLTTNEVVHKLANLVCSQMG